MQNNFTRTKLLAVVAGTIMFFLLPKTSSAQEPTTPANPNAAQSTGSSSNPQNPQEKKDAQPDSSSSTSENGNPEPPHAPVAPASPLFRLGGGGLLGAEQSPLRLGPLYVGTIDAFGAYDRFTPSTGVTPDQSQSGAVVLSDIIFDVSKRKSRVTVQWEPQVSILQGVTRGDVQNVSASLQTTLQLSERLGVTLSDNFSNLSSRLLYGDIFFTSGTVQIPAAQQNNFLDAPGHSLSEVARANFGYRLSQLTTFNVVPSFSYYHTNSNSTQLDSSASYASEFSLNHVLTPRTTIGLGYTISAVKIKTIPDFTLYQTVTGTYVHLFTPSLSFTGSAGLSTYVGGGAPRTWTFSGSASLQKSFKTSYVSVAFIRGLSLADYTTYAYTDRLDAQAGVQVNQRLNMRVGGGFQREARDNGFQGRYAEAVASFRLAQTLTLYGRYTYTFQTGDQQYLITGSRNLYVLGLRWDAGVHPRY
jgi:hypothetical protein